MKNPKVSILTVTYNRPQLIGKAIKSIQAQTFKDWEIIVVDDSTGKDTERIVLRLAKEDGRIKYFKKEKKESIASASNFAIHKSKGEYIAILDDDDCWAAPEKLGKQVEFLDKSPEYVGCGGGAIAVDGNEKELFKFLKPEQNEQIKAQALYANPLINSTTLFRSSVAGEIGFYDETLAQFADWDFWLKMGLKGKLYNFPEYFLYYRVWEEGASFKRQIENARSARRIIKRYRDKYPKFAIALFLAYLYSGYVRLPGFVKKILNTFLSRTKKKIFSN